ncbi:MAG: hypothetical protein LJE96_18075 [Deltaproteobacteria bacterium]|jgi:hypothetical protein|nr:hypothetical protein [Deltaproteobacteria bacterium]
MKMFKKMSIALLFCFVLPFAASAGDFDGSKPLICSTGKVIECTPEGGCQEVTPESVAVPQFLTVDLDKKTIEPTGKSDGDRKSIIKRLERLEGRLILQGSDEGIQDIRDSVGWSATLSQETGKFVVTASGDQVAFIVYGACTQLP